MQIGYSILYLIKNILQIKMDRYCKDLNKTISSALKRINNCDHKMRESRNLVEYEKYSECYQLNFSFFQALRDSHQKHCGIGKDEK